MHQDVWWPYDRWLAADDASSTWPVAYHGTAAVNMEPITRDKGLKAGGKDGVKRTNGARFGTGIYVSPLPEFALRVRMCGSMCV